MTQLIPNCPRESSHLLPALSIRGFRPSDPKIFCGLERADLLYSGDSGREVNGMALAFSLP